jgi:hypothetical protein
MGSYRVAEVCPNGHVSTSSADTSPELREKFCSSCGEPTMTQCESCKASIRGDYNVEGVFTLSEYMPPAHCHNCGAGFPWTARKVESAVELVEVGGELSETELAQLRIDLTELTKDSPKTQVASLRVKKAMEKVGSALAHGVREIVVNVLSEAAKKAIWGG